MTTNGLSSNKTIGGVKEDDGPTSLCEGKGKRKKGLNLKFLGNSKGGMVRWI